MSVKWPHKVHKMLLLWLSQIGLIRKIHHNESVRLSDWDDRMTIVIIVLSSLTAIASFVNVIDFSQTTKNVITIIVGSINILIGIISGIGNKMKLGESSQKHQAVSSEYADISNLIQCAAVSANKPDPAEFMKGLTDRIGLIQRFGPPLTRKDLSIADLPNYLSIYNLIETKKVDDEVDIVENDIDLFISEKSKSGVEVLNEIVIDQYLNNSSDTHIQIESSSN